MTNDIAAPPRLAPHAARMIADTSDFDVLDYDYDDGVFVGRFRGSIAGESLLFEERLDFRGLGVSARPRESLLRLLALCTSLSYYKATHSASFVIAFALSPAEVRFLSTLIEHGLGEYAFQNNAEWKLLPSISAPERSVSPDAPAPPQVSGRPFVAVGGGKDSIVSIEALKSSGHHPVLFSVNARGAIDATVRASGLEHFTIHRVIDPLLLAVNSAGAPNGHVPVTAMNSIIGLIASDLFGGGSVVFSNEESADHGNLMWGEREINHQWSKSIEYEDLLRETLRSEAQHPDYFFSLIRGYRELEVTRAFSRHPEYFDSFSSCNRAYRIVREDGERWWCGECPKCAFVFLLLAPYLGRKRLVETFGRDMLAESSQAPRMKELLGFGPQKPFECVGEPSEAAQALLMVARLGEWSDSTLVDELVELEAGMIDGDPGDAALGEDRVPSAFHSARDEIGREK